MSGNHGDARGQGRKGSAQLQRRVPLRTRTPMPRGKGFSSAGKAPLSQCGKHFATATEAAGKAQSKNFKTKSGVKWETAVCPHGLPVVVKAGTARAKALATDRTGFSPAVKLAVRARAGSGDVDAACCESCGIWLGRYGGEIQHVCARGMGGSLLANGVGNGALLCGNSLDKKTCHGRCEARDPVMRRRGFWRRSTDPVKPIDLHGLGHLFFLTDSGLYRPADEVEAA